MSQGSSKNGVVTGGCYCGALRYEVLARPHVKGQCHCCACQVIAGGGPNYFMMVAPDAFQWTRGTPRTFRHPDVDGAVTRHFCPTCGTHILTTRPDMPDNIVKIGTLDAPERFVPRIVIHFAEAQPFHLVPPDTPVFDTIPQR